MMRKKLQRCRELMANPGGKDKSIWDCISVTTSEYHLNNVLQTQNFKFSQPLSHVSNQIITVKKIFFYLHQTDEQTELRGQFNEFPRDHSVSELSLNCYQLTPNSELFPPF